MPDLYRGEPVALAARVSALPDAGDQGHDRRPPWVVTLPLAQAVEGRGLSKLWARRKIADAEVARTLRRITPDEADARVLAVALDHHLVTRLTSLVAVDQTPSRPDGARLTRAEIRSTCRPAGISRCSAASVRLRRCRRNGVPTPSRRGMRSWQPRRRGGVERAQASGSEVRIGAPRRRDLPQTATHTELRLWIGLALCGAGPTLMPIWRRRHRCAARGICAHDARSPPSSHARRTPPARAPTRSNRRGNHPRLPRPSRRACSHPAACAPPLRGLASTLRRRARAGTLACKAAVVWLRWIRIMRPVTAALMIAGAVLIGQAVWIRQGAARAGPARARLRRYACDRQGRQAVVLGRYLAGGARLRPASRPRRHRARGGERPGAGFRSRSCRAHAGRRRARHGNLFRPRDTRLRLPR